MTESVITGYHYDSDNFFYDGTRVVQKINGVANYPKYVIATAPALKDGYWYKCTDGVSWTAIAKPGTCAEAIKTGLSAVSNSPKVHDREVCALLQNLVEAESDAYRIKTDSDTLEMSIEEIPEPTFEEVKTEKESELASVAGQYDQYKCDSMYITSSLGFRVNADIRSQTNMQGLIDVLSDTDSTKYKDYDNVFQTVTKADLTTMKAEAITNGQNLYAQKWQLQAKIDAATTVEELNAIEIAFTMMDFSA